MLRLITCRHATLLLDQRADLPLAGRDRRSLWLHLRLCPLCQRYSEQTVLIARLARASAARRANEGPGLPETTKARLRTLLAAQ